MPVAEISRRIFSQRVSGVSGRYARSLFELAGEAGEIDTVTDGLTRFQAMIAESADLKRLLRSGAFSRKEQAAAVSALCEKAGIQGLAGNFINTVAANGRISGIEAMIGAYLRIAAEARGEVGAEITAAHPLSSSQKTELQAAINGATGKQAAMEIAVDPALIGGLVVKLGSLQIDTSLRTKLSTLELALKEVG